jgi:hypothetical protein
MMKIHFLYSGIAWESEAWLTLRREGSTLGQRHLSRHPESQQFPLPCCRHTLWKRVQGVVTPLLASMISVIDRDGNLELLTRPDSPAWARDLWMFIFSDTKLLHIPLEVNSIR